ncbi:hypothetical protein F5Y15DRAFT_392777 [Xylariaceae sp. FL0016]|nr:hypothetical protein F5Y15DRAFT_392777 [Xylariaceae sp. FL0016]
MDEEDVEQFMMITGVEQEHVARGYLEISNGDAMQAIQLFFENPELQSSFTNQQPASASRGQGQRAIGREDASGVIHIDSDDEDVSMTNNPNHFTVPDDDSDDGGIAAVARNAQEEEDAAMARRMQEELYAQGGGGQSAMNDEVRAPIARTTEMLAAPSGFGGMGDMDDDAEAFLEQQRARAAAQRRRRAPGGVNNNPFSQSRPTVWDDPQAPAVPNSSRPGGASTERAARLADLFRPPYDLISTWTIDEARDEGKEQKKWILVNLQNSSIFQCQSLNRDIWKDEGVKNLIREHFIFLQYDKTDHMAQEYITFYFPNQSHENDDIYPHVAIVDPRTGEQVKVWSGDPFPSAAEFIGDLVEFLDRYSLAANSKNPVQQSKPKQKQVDVGRLTEEEMLQLAMQNSLENNGGASGSNVQDPDSLTKEDLEAGDKGKMAEDVASTESAFAGISSTNPHVEPIGDPKASTRIQFRHPSGRVIRRFATTDSVQRIFEWLKAEPLEGKEGMSFELRTMPAGKNLIEELDKTIDEAGLKQATVAVEFTED